MVKESFFKNYPEALYENDDMFQKYKRHIEIMEETKVTYNRKLHVHGYNEEISVLLTGIAIGMFTYCPGSIYDIGIFRKLKDWHGG